MSIMKPSREVGIVGYGAYLPRYRLPAAEVARVWMDGEAEPPIKEKAVAGLDEDATTTAIEAARNALRRAGIASQLLRAVWVGTESKPLCRQAHRDHRRRGYWCHAQHRGR